MCGWQWWTSKVATFNHRLMILQNGSPPEIERMSPKKGPFEKETNHLPNIMFQWIWYILMMYLGSRFAMCQCWSTQLFPIPDLLFTRSKGRPSGHVPSAFRKSRDPKIVHICQVELELWIFPNVMTNKKPHVSFSYNCLNIHLHHQLQ